ncbi:MAG: ferrochelatase [Gemmatimonadales bacterium]
MADTARPHLLLVNLGTPDAPTPGAVRAFLSEFLSDPAVVDLPRWLWRPILKLFVLRSRPRRVAAMYRSVWSDRGSPLRVATERMAYAAGAAAAGGCTVSCAYRYGEPSLDSEMRRLAREQDGPVVVVPLFPHRTDATTGTAFKRAREAASRAGIAHRYNEALVAPTDAGYVAALTDRCRAAFGDGGSRPDHLVISFHGIPVRYDRRERGQYTRDCEETARALLDALQWPAEQATLAYQSKFGPEPWLTPATAPVIEALGRRGVRRVAVVTPGFLTHGLETLEEIAIRARESFVEAGGGELRLVDTVEDHPAMIGSLVRLATARSGSACIA